MSSLFANRKQLLTEMLRTSRRFFRIAAVLNNLVGFNQLTEPLVNLQVFVKNFIREISKDIQGR